VINIREFFPVNFIIDSNNYHCIWFCDGKDGLIVESGKIKSFSNIDALNDYAENNNFKLNDDDAELSIDAAKKWLANKATVDCSYFNYYWNMIGDMANSLNISFYGNKRTKHVDKLYDKLFYGCNPPSLRGNGEIYVPKFTKKEIRILRKVVKDGLRIVRYFLI